MDGISLILSVYLIIAGVMYGAQSEGIIKDDTYKKTVDFELKAAKKKVAHLENIANKMEDKND